VALAPGLDRAWYGLALVRMQQRRFGEAAEALQHNTALQPLGPYGWYRLAQVWLALGEPGKARKVIAHLRRFEPRVAAQLEGENAAALQAGRAPTSEAVDAAR
jgi:predicted Zn-dependent protease